MRIKILVIDDEEALCEILKFNLEKEGYEVDCAYSAEEALEMDLSSYSLFMVDIMISSADSTLPNGYAIIRKPKTLL